MVDTIKPPLTIEFRIKAARPGISLKDQKRLRLDMVIRVARRLDARSLGCETCHGHRTAIDSLVARLDTADSWTLGEWKAYYRSLDGMIKHLKTAHKMAEEGDNMAMWVGAGAAIGAGVGAAFGQIAIGAGIGVALGAAVGGMMDAIAHKQGRVI